LREAGFDGHMPAMNTKPLLSFLLLGLIAIAGNSLAKEPVALFDGKSLDHWMMDKEGAWIAKDGELTTAEGKAAGGYIWSKDKYEDFTLSLEFKMSEKCNSGVFFRTDPKNAVQGGFEIQVMDTAANETPGKHDCGALYDALAPSVNAAKPAGEWQTMSITCKGPQITVVLNGKTVVEANIDEWKAGNLNPDGSKNKFKTALKDIPRNNHIGLQYHGHPVWFRNIQIETL
jgi:hypothetical protein